MPTKAQFRLMLMVSIGTSAALILPRMWAARKAAENDQGVTAVVANGIQAFV